jgi:hypothetical protein
MWIRWIRIRIRNTGQHNGRIDINRKTPSTASSPTAVMGRSDNEDDCISRDTSDGKDT